MGLRQRQEQLKRRYNNMSIYDMYATILNIEVVERDLTTRMEE